MRKLSHKGLDKKALKFWAEIGRTRSNGVCEICGRTGNIQCHHFFGRKNKSVRYELENCIPLCYSCHKGNSLSAHESPAWFQEQIVKKRGKKWLKDLTQQWRESVKWDSFYIQEQIDHLTQDEKSV